MVISAVFPPEFTYSGRVSEQIAYELARRGHEVTVLAPFPNRPGGQLFAGYRRSLYRRAQAAGGYALIHCFSTLAPSSKMISRFFENITFGLTSACRLMTCKRPDIVYSNSWPIVATALMALVARLRGIPFVVAVQDVYPESLITQGHTQTQSLLVRIMRAIDRNVAQSAASLIVISERFRELYIQNRGVPDSRVHLVHNWADMDQQTFIPGSDLAFREKKQIPRDAFLAVYGGNVGPASGAEGLVDAFVELRDISAYLLVAGAGSRLQACREKADQFHCERVLFLTPWKDEDTAPVLGAADVTLLPTISNQSQVSVPSKLISYMLAGKPVIAQVHQDSETARMLEAADAGWVLPPDEPRLLGAKLRELASMDRHILAEKGLNGRRFALENLSRESNLPKSIRILLDAARH